MSFLCLSVLHGGRAVIPWTVTGIPVGTTFLALFDQLRAGALEAFAGHAPVLQRMYFVYWNVYGFWNLDMSTGSH